MPQVSCRSKKIALFDYIIIGFLDMGLHQSTYQRPNFLGPLIAVKALSGHCIRPLHCRLSMFGPSPKWDQSTMHNMLRNRATVGEHQPKEYRENKEFPMGDPIPNYYPAAIEESLFQAAQAARQKNLASGRGRKGRLITNLFAGFQLALIAEVQ
jgi:hypothetical protein